jgi:hypothetical protein
MAVRHKCFISYHHADQTAVDKFVRDFDHGANCFIARGLGKEMAGDIVDSTDVDYVMGRIRNLYLSDSTVTIVLMGACTWARRYVDWEIQSSLRQGEVTVPNGLLGIKLPSFSSFPERFRANLSDDWPAVDCYARHITYPKTVEELVTAIERAHERRATHRKYIVNPRERMGYNRNCG